MDIVIFLSFGNYQSRRKLLKQFLQSIQTHEAAFTPCIDIGWGIKRSEWNRGFATEGAERCLKYAFRDLRIEKIHAIAPKANTKSEHIMTKVEMSKLFEFEHPLLLHDEKLKTCLLYQTQLENKAFTSY